MWKWTNKKVESRSFTHLFTFGIFGFLNVNNFYWGKYMQKVLRSNSTSIQCWKWLLSSWKSYTNVLLYNFTGDSYESCIFLKKPWQTSHALERLSVQGSEAILHYSICFLLFWRKTYRICLRYNHAYKLNLR